MARRILILGGTQFFGKKLVRKLIENGDDVSIATRGKTEDDFGDSVGRFIIDRKNEADLQKLVADTTWDVIYDNLCFTPQDAMMACRAFSGKVKRYIVTSTLATYEPDGVIKTEADFDPYHYKVDLDAKLTYADGKRASEAVFYQQADFPVIAVRIPIVLGVDDFTKRLHFHVEHVKNEQEIGIPNLETEMCFIISDEAADFLFWVSGADIDGPVNACSDNQLKLSEIVSILEEKIGKKAFITDVMTAENQSPFGIVDSWYMDTNKAKTAGFKFKDLHDWFPKLVVELAKEEN